MDEGTRVLFHLADSLGVYDESSFITCIPEAEDWEVAECLGLTKWSLKGLRGCTARRKSKAGMK